MRRSAYSSTFLKRGHVLKKKDIIFLRPGFGINEQELKNFLGKKIKIDLDKFKQIKKIFFR